MDKFEKIRVQCDGFSKVIQDALGNDAVFALVVWETGGGRGRSFYISNVKKRKRLAKGLAEISQYIGASSQPTPMIH